MSLVVAATGYRPEIALLAREISSAGAELGGYSPAGSTLDVVREVINKQKVAAADLVGTGARGARINFEIFTRKSRETDTC